MAYAEIKKAPLDLTGRVLGRIGDPGSAQPQALHPASRYSGEDASAGLTVSRFDPPRLARAHGATPPCGPGLSRNRRQLAVGSCLIPIEILLAALCGNPRAIYYGEFLRATDLNHTRMRVVRRTGLEEAGIGDRRLPVALTALQNTSNRADYRERERGSRGRKDGKNLPPYRSLQPQGGASHYSPRLRFGGVFGRPFPRWFPLG